MLPAEHDYYADLLARYLRHDCTDDERAQLDRWYAALGQTLPAVAEADVVALGEKNWNAVAKRIQHQVVADTLTDGPVISLNSRRAGLSRIGWAVAASVAVLLLAGVGFWQSGWFGVRSELVTRVNQSSSIQKISLADGSVVWLKPHSTLRYQNPMAADQRLITLDGQAFFDVAKDPNRPFTVTAGGFGTTALGTSFDIRAYGNDVRIALQTGKVRVRSAKTNRQWSLLPGQQLTGHLTDTTVAINRFAPDVLLAWQSGNVAFDNEPLSAVLSQISAQYGVPIQFDEQRVRRCFVTARFAYREPVDNVLSVLLFPNQLQVQKIKNVYVVSGTGCQ